MSFKKRTCLTIEKQEFNRGQFGTISEGKKREEETKLTLFAIGRKTNAEAVFHLPTPSILTKAKGKSLKLWVTTVQPIAFTKPKKIGVIVSNLMMSLLLTRRDVFLNTFMHAFYAGLGKNSFLKKVIKSETTEVLKLKKKF